MKTREREREREMLKFEVKKEDMVEVEIRNSRN